MSGEINRDNLQKLASFLAYGDLPKEVEFDMETFSSHPDAQRFADEDAFTLCGTAGCAVGFAPFAGFPKSPAENWTEYSQRLFGIDFNECEGEWDWCFSSEWAFEDNTPLGAAKRIQYLVDNGVSPQFDDYADAISLYVDVVVKKPAGTGTARAVDAAETPNGHGEAT